MIVIAISPPRAPNTGASLTGEDFPDPEPAHDLPPARLFAGRTRRPAAACGRPRLAPLPATLAIVLLAGAAPCGADQGVALNYGRHGEVHTRGLQWLLPVWYQAETENWRISGYPELQLNQHHRRSEDLVHAGAFATFRVAPVRAGAYPYVEAGLGVNFFSDDRLGPKQLSTRFQFGELVGAGVAWGGRPASSGENSVGLRFSHYSNGGLKQPNNGLEVIQFIVSHRF